MHDKFFINYFTLAKIILSAFTGNLTDAGLFKGTGLESMWWRAYHWNLALSDLKKTPFLILFGSGVSFIYTESFLIRIITSFGIVGCLIISYLTKNLPLFFIVFILITGITIDMFVSFKIFIFSSLLLIIIKKSKLKLK